jgi:hypothetical protein
MPSVPKPSSSNSRRRASVWKAVEREAGKWGYEHDGPDPAMANTKWVSSTGRVANTTQAQHDVRTLHYCGECKSQQKLPKWLWTVYKPVLDGKAACLRLSLPHCPTMVLITREFHADLLAAERGEYKPQGPFVSHGDGRGSAPEWLTTAWLQITQVAKNNGKAAWLYLRQPLRPPIHGITSERYAELLGYTESKAA